MSPRGAATHLAFVLHRYDWSESSLIVDLFTREAGRVAVAAKGAKRPTSTLRAVLLPFQRIAVSFGRSAHDDAASDIRNLRGAEWGGGAPLAGGADALLAGFYANELVMKLLARDDPHPALWDAYAATLPHLGGADEAAALRAFELALLVETGHLPDVAHVTATQGAIEAARRYALRPETGLVEARADDDAAVPGSVFAALQSALDAHDLDALRVACRSHPAPLRRQLRAWLAYHLGGTPLRTREVVRDLQPLLAARTS
ncbi:MAG TPA: DNA repair protein RecO [Burkholderiaceae bacterium]|nr:DNA repair protein RecO [Burkholderiaceae bacterium]